MKKELNHKDIYESMLNRFLEKVLSFHRTSDSYLCTKFYPLTFHGNSKDD